jgi:hypothetical protein
MCVWKIGVETTEGEVVTAYIYAEDDCTPPALWEMRRDMECPDGWREIKSAARLGELPPSGSDDVDRDRIEAIAVLDSIRARRAAAVSRL